MSTPTILATLHELKAKTDPSQPSHLDFLIVPGQFIRDVTKAVTKQYAIIESLKAELEKRHG